MVQPYSWKNSMQKSILQQRAKQLRKHSTDAEKSFGFNFVIVV